MVYRTQKVYRTKFRNLPIKGNDYWPATSTASAPLIKYNRTNSLSGYTQATGAATLTAVSPTLDVIRVPQVFLGQRAQR